MCTVSWWRNGDDYGVLFNRDESRRRLEAEPPATRHLGPCAYISPIDRDAGGTWIWVNQHGVTSCILNNYPRLESSVSNPVSRGLLLKSLADLDSAEKIRRELAAAELPLYRAFFILAFDKHSLEQISWDGEMLLNLRNDEVSCPLTTSGFRPEEVISYRRELFGRRFGRSPNPCHKDLAAYQSEYDPRMPAHSVLMARDDARTVSQSHVHVTGNSVMFSYYSVSEDNQLQPVNSKTLSRE